MKLSIAAIVTTVLATAASIHAQILINTPSSVLECEPTLLSWNGGVAPYFLAVVDGNNPSTTLENIGQVNGTSFSFVVNFASGTSLELSLRDNTGATAVSGAFPVQAGSNTACVSTTGSTASTTAGGSSTTSDTSSASSTTTTDSTSGHALITSGSFATPTTSTSNAAAGLIAHFSELGVAVGIVGAVMAAFALQIVG